MSASFTPGPWTFLWNVPDIAKQEPTSGVAWLGKGDIKNRCRVDIAGPNTLANANLIAAAPDLFAVVEEWLTVGNDLKARKSVREKARAALAKARGEA